MKSNDPHPRPSAFPPPPKDKVHTCRNCGLVGHLYRDCPHPIMSFGVICFRVTAGAPGSPEYLMVQRKDSLCFMEFIRGKYDPTNVPYVAQLVSGMTQAEHALMLHLAFEDLWNHVWYQPHMPRQSPEFLDSKAKFEMLRATCLETLIRQATTRHTEPEWGFPKGRRRLREEDPHCAVREFCEETGFAPEDLALLEDQKPMEEVFFGTNHVLYRHVYYIGQLVRAPEDGYQMTVDPNNVSQAREVRAISWFPYEEVMSHIRDHNIERKQIFHLAHQRVLAALGAAPAP